MKKATNVVMAVLCIAVIIGVSCSKSSEDELGPQNPPACDTVNMTYSADVVPILQASCYSCHGNGQKDGGIALGTYADVKIQTDNGALLGGITHAAGYVPMPLGGAKLSDCNIDKIKDWINRGAVNN